MFIVQPSGEDHPIIMTTTTEPEPDVSTPYLLNLDPGALLAHPRNVRQDLGDLSDLKATIAGQGVLQALTVIPDGGGYRIVFGHRRAAAAVEVIDDGDWPAPMSQTVPCLVRPDLASMDADQLVGMLNENDKRLALTNAERAAGYAQLELFGLDALEIARRTGNGVPYVRSSLRLHRLGEEAAAATNRGDLTFDDIASLEEFDDDPEAMDRILKSARNSWGVKHRINEERRTRDQKATLARLTEELAAGGVKVIAPPKGWPYECREARVADLRTSDGESVDLDEVKATEGFAAFVESQHNGQSTAVYVCLDPDAHGYKRHGYTRYKNPQQVAAAEAARKAAAQREALLTEAQEVRERFLVERYGNAKAAKRLIVNALRATIDSPDYLNYGDAELIQALAGGDINQYKTAGQDRLTRLLVAIWIAAEEENLTSFVRHAYGANLQRAVDWLNLLVDSGYELAPAEDQLRQDLIEKIAERTRGSAATATDDDTDGDADADALNADKPADDQTVAAVDLDVAETDEQAKELVTV